jgi:hypothetical protein
MYPHPAQKYREKTSKKKGLYLLHSILVDQMHLEFYSLLLDFPVY